MPVAARRAHLRTAVLGEDLRDGRRVVDPVQGHGRRVRHQAAHQRRHAPCSRWVCVAIGRRRRAGACRRTGPGRVGCSGVCGSAGSGSTSSHGAQRREARARARSRAEAAHHVQYLTGVSSLASRSRHCWHQWQWQWAQSAVWATTCVLSAPLTRTRVIHVCVARARVRRLPLGYLVAASAQLLPYTVQD